MSNIVQELEAQIRNISTASVSENVGTIKAIGDGVAHIEGLSNAMLNEMIEFPGGVMGLAMNLEEHEVGAVLIGNEANGLTEAAVSVAEKITIPMRGKAESLNAAVAAAIAMWELMK